MRNGVRGFIVGLSGLVVLVGGFTAASNMGFKFVPDIHPYNFFNLAVPWNSSYTHASDIFSTLRTQGCDVDRVTKYTSIGTYLDWFLGAPHSNDFPVVPGEAYIVHNGCCNCTTATVTGSHNPNLTFTFLAGQFFNAAPPYHQTLTNAAALFNDMATQLGTGKVTRLSKYTEIGTFLDWFRGAPRSNNFHLDLGMGVIVFSEQTGTGYVWPHY